MRKWWGILTLPMASGVDRKSYMHMKLLDIANLASGTERQKKALSALTTLRLFDVLKAHSPVLTGAIPLDLETPESAIEVICSTDNLENFGYELSTLLGSHERFALHHQMIRGRPAVTASFHALDFAFEILGQEASVFTQPGVVLMLTEARLLTFAPQEIRDRIRALKRTGHTTEAAFAICLALTGDPTEEIMKISRMPDHEMLQVTHRFRFAPH